MPNSVEIGILISARNQASAALTAVGEQVQQLEKKVQSLGPSFANVGKQLQGAGAGLTAGLTVPLAGMGTAALMAATDFNAAMANVASLGVPIERVNELKSSVQGMSVELGKGTGDLADGLYQVVSAFGDGADTVEVLRINAQAAAAGLATTTDAINLTSAITKAYGDTSAGAVQNVADLAFQTVKLGQTTFPELAGSMGRVAPLASSLGVSVEDLFGTMATFTGVTGGANEVSTQLRGVLQSLMAPTDAMAMLLQSLGFASGGAMVEQLGLQASIEAIVNAANETGAPLQNFIGSIEGQTLALAATGGQADVFASKLAAMGDVVGSSDAAFAAQTEGVNKVGFQWQQLQQQLGVFAQRLGDVLAPAAGALLASLEPLIGVMDRLISAFEGLDPTTQTVLIGIAAAAAALGPVLVAVGTAMTMAAPAIGAVGAALGVLFSPIGLIVAAVGLLGAAWVTNFMGIQDATAGVAAAIGEAFGGLQTYFQMAQEDGWNFSDHMSYLFSRLPESVQQGLTGTQTALQEGMVGMQTMLTSAGEALGALLEPAFGRIAAAFSEMPSQLAPLGEAFGSLVGALGEAFVAIQPVLGAIGQAIGAVFGVVAVAAVNLFSSTLQAVIPAAVVILQQLTVMVDLVSSVVTNMVTLVVALFTGDWQTAFSSAQAIGEAFATAFSSTLSNLGTLAGIAMTAVSTAVINTLTDLGVNVPALLEQLSSSWNLIWGGLTGAVDAVRGGIDGLRGALEGFSSWAGGLSIPNPFAGWQMPTMPPLPGFGAPHQAIGSLAFGGGLAVVGETGPELVLLPAGSRTFGSQELSSAQQAAGATINVQNMNVRAEADLYILAHEVARLLSRR